MSTYLYIFSAGLAFLGLMGAVSIWPERPGATDFEYALPIALAINSLIMPAILAALGVIIDHLEAIRTRFTRPASVANTRTPSAPPMTESSESADPTATDSRGVAFDGRSQTLAYGRVRQLDNGRWCVEHVDGTPHSQVTKDFATMGAAKRALQKSRD